MGRTARSERLPATGMSSDGFLAPGGIEGNRQIRFAGSRDHCRPDLFDYRRLPYSRASEKRGDEMDLDCFRVRKEGAMSNALWRAFPRPAEVPALRTARGLCRMRVAAAAKRSLGPGFIRRNTRAERNFSGASRRAHRTRVSVRFDSRDQACELEGLSSDEVAVAGTCYHRRSESRRRPAAANRFACNESNAVRTAFPS